MISFIKRLLIGKPLRTERLKDEALPVWKALPILSSDAISSLAYGPQEMLLVLFPVGFLAMGYSLPITMAIVILLFLLVVSYRQVIMQYPGGGGAYIVSSENLGLFPGLVAGVSLLLDYVLTCAVSITSGVDAIKSAFSNMPDYAHYVSEYKVLISVILIFLIMFLNLRGLRESSNIFAFPTYFFIAMTTILVISGLWKTLVLNESIAAPPFPPEHSLSHLTWFVLLHAFSSGCSSLTGVEAIANATATFREPAAKRASFTLLFLGLILGVLLIGLVYLTYSYGIIPSYDPDADTILSRVGEITFGRGFIYYLIQIATALILILAANTSFASLPLLCFSMAKDSFLPRMFTIRGDRLNFSNGIIALAFASVLLVVIFDGNVSSLIPLYAIGVFLSFTLSQFGMVKRWYKKRPPGWLGSLIINAIGGLVTLLVLLIFSITKFSEGAWIILVILPIMVMFFYGIYKHYKEVGLKLRLREAEEFLTSDEHLIVIPVGSINRIIMNTMAYACRLKGRMVAVHVSFDLSSSQQFREQWQQMYPDVKLLVIYSRFRSLVHPILRLVEIFLQDSHVKDRCVTLLLPELIPKRWFQRILHNQSTLFIRLFLLTKRNVILTTIPFRM